MTKTMTETEKREVLTKVKELDELLKTVGRTAAIVDRDFQALHLTRGSSAFNNVSTVDATLHISDKTVLNAEQMATLAANIFTVFDENK